MRKFLILLTTLLFLVVACSKSETSAPPGGEEGRGKLNEPGYGKSRRPFTAPNWQLPAGVELEDSIHDYSYCWAFPPNTQVPMKDWRGVPVGFAFCITLRNNRHERISIPFPPELVFVSSSMEHQNVLVIQTGVVDLPADGSLTIVAQGLCLNASRHPPATFEDGTENFLGYSFGPSTVPSALQEVLAIVEAKHLTNADVLLPNGTIDPQKTVKFAVVQQAIWDVTDGDGLTADTRQKLEAL